MKHKFKFVKQPSLYHAEDAIYVAFDGSEKLYPAGKIYDYLQEHFLWCSPYKELALRLELYIPVTQASCAIGPNYNSFKKVFCKVYEAQVQHNRER